MVAELTLMFAKVLGLGAGVGMGFSVRQGCGLLKLILVWR